MSDVIKARKSDLYHSLQKLRMIVPVSIADEIKAKVDSVIDAYENQVCMVPSDGENNPKGKVVIKQGDKVIGAQG